jgi:carboxyl-terminal processing protease
MHTSIPGAVLFSTVIVSAAAAWALLVTATAAEAQSGPSSPGRASRPAPRAVRTTEGSEPKRLFEVLLTTVDQRYYAPSRLRPRRMLVAALGAIEAMIPEVIAARVGRTERWKLEVGQRVWTVDLASVDSVERLDQELYQAVAFVLRHVDDRSMVMDLQRAVFAAMLKTLDPHCEYFPPKRFARIQKSLLGAAGGLGIVTGRKKGKVVIREVISGGPAAKAGLEAADRLIKIGDLEVADLPLSEVSDALQGREGSRVVLWIAREGWRRPRRFALTRRRVTLPSVKTRMVRGGVGWARISDFKANTPELLTRQVTELAQEGMKGLILDLRGNWGGFVGAAIQIAERFVEKGLLLVAVGRSGEVQKEWRATREATRFHVPLVILVDRSTASAAEILAGCLQAAGRGVVVGQRTWGKGTAQELFHTSDGGAYKLSSYQYRLAGGGAIHLRGVQPDVAVDSVKIARNETQLLRPGRGAREISQWRSHVDGRARSSSIEVDIDPPSVRLPLLRAEGRDETAELAADMLRNLPEALSGSWKPHEIRKGLLEHSESMLAVERDRQEKAIRDRLADASIDWSPAPAEERDEKGVSLEVRIRAEPAVVEAGDTIEIELAAANGGTKPVYRFGGVIRSGRGWLDGEEIVLGRLEPGETSTGAVEVRVPVDVSSHTVFFEVWPEASSIDRELLQTKACSTFQVRGLVRPRFAYSWQLDDGDGGNGNGLLEPGEEGSLRFRIKNEGGDAENVLVDITGSSPLLAPSRPRTVVGEIGSGRWRAAAVPVRFGRWGREGSMTRSAWVEVTVYDKSLGAHLRRRLAVPVAFSTFGCRPAQAAAIPMVPTHLLAAGSGGASRLARVERGARLTVVAECGRWLKISLDDGMFGYLTRGEVALEREAAPKNQGSRTAARADGARFVLSERGPRLAVRLDDVGGRYVGVSGDVSDLRGVRDLWVATWSLDGGEPRPDKIYYKAAPKESVLRQLDFGVRIEARGGAQMVGVVARNESKIKTVSRLSFFRPPSPIREKVIIGFEPPSVPVIVGATGAEGSCRSAGCGCRSNEVEPSLRWVIAVSLFMMVLLLGRRAGRR